MGAENLLGEKRKVVGNMGRKKGGGDVVFLLVKWVP